MSRSPCTVEAASPDFPEALKSAGVFKIWTIGQVGMLRKPLLGLLCSTRCPGEVILKTYDVVRSLRDRGVPVIGGFHSPMEKECLDLLLRGTQPIVVCPARSIERMRVPAGWRDALASGQLLIVSPFAAQHRHPRIALAEQRNRFVATLAAALFVPHAAPGSKTERLCREQLDLRKAVLLLAERANSDLVGRGASILPVGEIASHIAAQLVTGVTSERRDL